MRCPHLILRDLVARGVHELLAPISREGREEDMFAYCLGLFLEYETEMSEDRDGLNLDTCLSGRGGSP
ncbi:hypothetical protein AZE42_08312 [Rhizopogon vesiculosus]|uniref:Uncharacterized protein n=1 Tax=Rhizopogon vesiculosus TaxID=180088 RepID=A0A1J8Q549_9AGAM|nr:hypothetical protein AZE42_08312 [Rhizopogon vesiculosus]